MPTEVPLFNHYTGLKPILWWMLFPRRATSVQAGEMSLWAIQYWMGSRGHFQGQTKEVYLGGTPRLLFWVSQCL